MSRHQSHSAYKPTHRRRLVAIVLFTAMFAVACGSDFGSADSVAQSSADESFSFESDGATRGYATTESAPAEPASAAADDVADFGDNEAPEVGGAFNQTGSAAAEASAQLPDLGRDIIFTATLEIGSTDVSAATREAIRSIEARGGFLFSQETRGGAGGTSVLTFKVLPEQFQAALNDLGSVGNVRSQSISADDVSAVVVDLESRINTAEASVIRLRNLLDDASELETIATLENQLLQRETTLEQLRGQLRTVRNQVDLATITLVVTELLNRPAIAIDAMAYPGHDGGFGCFDSPSVRSAESGDAVTICYRLINTGDTPLVDVKLDDAALGATLGSVVVVDGSTTQIDPGESVLLAQEVELSEDVRVRTSVTATGLDADGNALDDEVKATAATMRFDVASTDDGIPSFGTVLSNSWNALVTAIVVIALIAVAIAPFVAAALLVGVPIWMLLRGRREERAAARAATRAAQAASQPPAPTPPPPPATPAADAGTGSTDPDLEPAK